MLTITKSGADAWNDYISYLDNPKTSKPFTFSVKPIQTMGVLLTQSCDIYIDKKRGVSPLVFAELTPNCGKLKTILDIKNKRTTESKDPQTIIDLKLSIIRQDTRFHLFPAESTIPVLDKLHVVDFRNIFQIPYELLKENLERFFVARLKSPAKDIFCDKISRFFTRLAFEDLIFLTDEEIKLRIKMGKLTLEEANDILTSVNRSIA